MPLDLQDYEQGWWPLSLYTGASVTELRAAVAAGEFVWSEHPDNPRVTHARLDAWLLVRLYSAQLLDHQVELPSNLQEAS